MIVREKAESIVLIEQHEHALISGEFAKRWKEEPYPLEPTLYAVANHDIAWQPLDEEVLWNAEKNRPYSFMDYPIEPKLRAYERGLDLLESRDLYAACLCSRHYQTLVRKFGKSEAEARFVEAESRRQERLRRGMSSGEIENLERNRRFLGLCDGLSLFVCLNEPGGSGYPPPYPGGFGFDGTKFEPVWEDDRTLRLEPNPFSEPFDLAIPYREVGRDGRSLGSGSRGIRIAH